MEGTLKETEHKILSLWKENNIYEKFELKNDNNELFILHSGPTYANEEIHLGNAYNAVLKDIIVKMHSAFGYKAFLVHGSDAHGLPIAQSVSKKYNIPMSGEQFMSLCEEHVAKNIISMRESMLRLGVFVARWYSTHNPEYISSEIEIVKQLYKGGFLFFDLAPVHVCYKCKTTLSFSEIEQHKGVHYDLFLLFNTNTDISVLIYTTTPFSLEFNQAVSWNSNLKYSVFNYKNKRFFALDSLILEDVEKERDATKEEILSLSLMNISGETVPLILSDTVQEYGSGFVHLSADNAWEDFNVLKTVNIGCRSIFDINTFTFKGNRTKEDVQIDVLEKLNKTQNIISFKSLNTDVPSCWRCKENIFCISVNSAFFNMQKDDLLKRCLDATDNMTFLPSSTSLKSTLSRRNNWCISRQRYWGVPLPALFCNKCLNVFFDERLFDFAKSFLSERKISDWYYSDITLDFQCKCSSKDLSIHYTSLDVWFDAALTHNIVLPNIYNTIQSDMLLEGNDQFKGWYQVSLLCNMALNNNANIKSILTHDFVVSKDMEKLSKSKQNYVSVNILIEEHGADIIRILFAMQEYDSPMIFDETCLQAARSEFISWKSAMKFVYKSLNILKEKSLNCSHTEIHSFDEACSESYIRHLNVLLDAYKQNFKIHVVLREWRILWKRLNKTFFQMVKSLAYTESTQERCLSAYISGLKILKNTIILWSTVCSYTAEEMWTTFNMFDEKSVFLSHFDSSKESNYNLEDVEEEIKKIDEYNENIKSIIWEDIWRLSSPKKQKEAKEICQKIINSK